MAITLLTSAATVKELTAIDDNLEGKYMATAIREAQDLDLCGVLGDALVNRLVALVAAGTIASYPAYKTLLDGYVSRYLAYAAAARLVPMTSYKVANAGVVKSSDERITLPDGSERSIKAQDFINTRDSYCRKMQRFILQHRSDYPEVDANGCYQMKANLHSAANQGIFLGGVRGKLL